MGESHHETLDVLPLQHPITVDGKIEDWLAQERQQRILTLTDSEWERADNTPTQTQTQEPAKSLRMWTGHHENRFYLAFQWEDETHNALYRPWKLSQGRYQRARITDDMFVVRLQLGESFQQCMLSNTSYKTDVWRWSAGRSNLSGVADDMYHAFSNQPFDKPVREYTGKNGMVYFLNALDAGFPGWQTVPQPTPGNTPVVPSIVKAGEPSESRADVLALGKWHEGLWTVEFSRQFKTNDPDDAVFAFDQPQVIQFAVFYAGYQLRKFITKPIALRLLPTNEAKQENAKQ